MYNNNQVISSGFLIVDKPVGPTSHDIVNRLRRITGVKRIGHAGTLDPFASGILIMAVGRSATREISRFVKLDKEYIAELRLGAETDTHDRTGILTAGQDVKPPTAKEVEDALAGFLGPQTQVPPMFSAKKTAGQPLYKLARSGRTVARAAVPLTINRLELMFYAWPRLELLVRCTSGTYIRALARDLGRRLACGAYVQELRRTAVGEFTLSQAVDIKTLSPENWHKYLIK